MPRRVYMTIVALQLPQILVALPAEVTDGSSVTRCYGMLPGCFPTGKLLLASFTASCWWDCHEREGGRKTYEIAFELGVPQHQIPLPSFTWQRTLN